MKYLLILISFLLFTGCKSSELVKETKAKTRIEAIETSLNKTNLQRLEAIGEYSYGVDLVNTNTTVEILNDRIQTLAEKPGLDAMKEMQQLVLELNTNNLALLNVKDKEIVRLQSAIKHNNDTLDSERAAYYDMSAKMAGENDNYKKTMDGFLGLSAIAYGLKKFIVSAMWFLGIGFVVFTVLRVASASNPIAGALFGIFNVLGSWVLNTIKKLIPGAVSMAKLVNTDTHESYLGLTDKLVDSIEYIRTLEASGKPQTIKDLLSQIDKATDTHEKEIISKCKKDLLW